MDAVTGVHNANDIEHWDDIEQGIDLDYEAHTKECETYQQEGSCECFTDTGTTLIGSWKKDTEDKYEPNPDGEYSAIYNPDYNTIQVVRSKYTIKCAPCSPCYPGQGDVDSPGDLIGFMLPPDMMREEWVTNNKERFV